MAAATLWRVGHLIIHKTKIIENEGIGLVCPLDTHLQNIIFVGEKRLYGFIHKKLIIEKKGENTSVHKLIFQSGVIYKQGSCFYKRVCS